jgi:hypothetical protein
LALGPQDLETLAKKYVIRSKWRKNQKRGAVPMASSPPAVIPMDTVSCGHRFAFTGVDIYTQEAAVVLRPALTSEDGVAFLRTAMSRRFSGRVEVRQPAGGTEFNGAFAQHARDYGDRHRMARPYKKKEQADIESFNRTLRKDCLGWGTYRTTDLAHLIPEVAPASPAITIIAHTWGSCRYDHRFRPHPHRRTDCRISTENSASA